MNLNQYPELFRALPMPCLILDKDFTIHEMTNVYLDITHRDRDALTGSNYFDVFANDPLDPERAAKVSEVLRKSLTKVRDQKVTDHLPINRFDLPDVNGSMSTHYWTTWSIPLLDSNGDLMFILHRVEDVTKYFGVLKTVREMGDNLHSLSDLMGAMLNGSLGE